MDTPIPIGDFLPTMLYRLLAEDAHGAEEGEHDEHSSFGVHITYNDLYYAILFLFAIYVCGQLASRLLRMPNLVGEIVAGILLGPELLPHFVPFPQAWVLFGEMGLVLLVLEAGIDIDVSSLKLIGTRGFLIAIVGSILPIAIGFILALAMRGSADMKANIAAGAAFGPTSLGIALNILKSGGVLNTPVGQLIISAAVIDDMIALIVLSMLEVLTEAQITAAAIVIPIISALAFLFIGGYIALFVFPGVLEKLVLRRTKSEYHGKFELGIMFCLLLLLMPATYYSRASYLMGAFIAGLAFCTSHDLHLTFVRQFKRVLQWLMRIFFAASIGFQVPIREFGSGTVLWQGIVFLIALVGKLAVGFMVPNFTQSRKYHGFHLRDCLVTGFSMAAEGEFAFVIAVYAVENFIIDAQLYASIVLAVLLSTIFPPFFLRFTISYYNKKAEQDIQRLAEEEMERNHTLEAESAGTPAAGSHNSSLMGQITSRRAVFLCIQTQSEAKWGLLLNMLGCLNKLGLDIIDHRSWHPRGISTTLVSEVYCSDKLQIDKKGSSQEILEARINQVREALEKVINQPDTSKVKVQRWFPGVVEEIVESVHEKKTHGRKSLNIEERLLREAAENLDKKQNLQTGATKEKTVEEILGSMQGSKDQLPVNEENKQANLDASGLPPPSRPRRRRQKMRSTPVVGGDMFGPSASTFGEKKDHDNGSKPGGHGTKTDWKPDFDFGQRGHKAEIIVQGESYDVRISNETLRALRTGFSGDMLDSRGLSKSGIDIQPDQSNVVNQLHGYVRNVGQLGRITEESVQDGESETSSMHHGGKSEDENDLPV